MTLKEQIMKLQTYKMFEGEDTVYVERDDVLKLLDQEPCEDAISRQSVLNGLASIAKAKAKSDAQKALMGRVMFFTEQLPPVTPQPKTGWWMIIDDCEQFIAKCSECGEVVDSRDISKYPYCHCGAKMQGRK